MTVAKHSFEVRFDDEFATQAKLSSRDARVADVAGRFLKRTLGELKDHFPVVFAQQMPRLERVEVRHRGGQTIEVASILVDPAIEIVDGDVAGALARDFKNRVEPRFRGRAPEQIQPAESAEWFEWIRLQEISQDDITVQVVRFAMSSGATDPVVAKRVRDWLIDRAEDLSRRSALPAPAPPKLEIVRQSYVKWLIATAPSFTEDETQSIALPLFRLPYDNSDAAYGYERPEPVDQWHFDGFDVFAFGASSIDRWVAAKARNAVMGWVQNAMATEAGARRLAQYLGSKNDRRLIAAAYEALPNDKKRASFQKALEPYPQAAEVARELGTRR
jgi:hypothetical protein